MLCVIIVQSVNPLTSNAAFDQLIHCNRLAYFFLHTISAFLQHKMHHRRADTPLAVYFVLQTNRTSVQKK